MDYLGITIDFSIPRKVVFIMFDYLEDVIVEANEDLKNNCSYYLGNDQLFKVDYDSLSLPSKGAELFCHHIARLLLVNKRARPDTQICIAFLCTRAKITNRTRLQ